MVSNIINLLAGIAAEERRSNRPIIRFSSREVDGTFDSFSVSSDCEGM